MYSVNDTKKLRAFSLVELIVSIGIIGIILLMLNTVIINTAIVAQKSLARSYVREEIATIADLIATDIRAADRVGVCEGEFEDDSLRCEIFGRTNVVWQTCTIDNIKRICKLSEMGENIFSSSPNLTITAAEFEIGFGTGAISTRRNIIVTLVADHANPSFNVTNVVRQTVISTRNYVLI